MTTKRGTWAPWPRVCWMCAVKVGSRHLVECVFEGVFR